ncbi:MAG: hypothetical protein LBQ54_06070 [Planctomycetaceae bacterium]|jgi:hypothetical protein|nr:hypothetical protein [Planctomycetaceae bacterium]
MTPFSFFVLEKTPLWKDFLLNKLRKTGEWECLTVQSFTEILERLEDFPDSLIVTELTSENRNDFLPFILRVKNHFPKVRTAVYYPELMGRTQEEYQTAMILLYQAGCIAVITTFCGLAGLVEPISWHYCSLLSEEQSVTERILSEAGKIRF